MPNPASSTRPLKRRVFEAGMWSAGGYAIGQALRFGSNLVMARLLAPDLFGLMALANVIMTGLGMLSDIGLRQSIVRSSRGGDPDFLNTAWAMQIVRGGVIWTVAMGVGLLIAFAQYVSLTPKDSVYSDARLPYVIYVLSSLALIVCFTSTKIFEETRNLTLYRITRIDLVSQVAGLTFMIVWAIVDRSIWALVSGGIVTALVKVALSHTWLQGASNRWHWDKAAFQELASFGKWILGASVLGFLASNTDRLLLGGLIDPRSLGIYVIAFMMFSVIDQILSKLMLDVTFPALSEVVRAKPHDLKLNYYRFQAVIGSVAYFSAGALMVSGGHLINLVYDARYHEAGPLLQILAIALIASPLGVAARCFVILGMPERLFEIGMIRLVTLIAATFGGFYFFQLHGAVWGITLSYFAQAPITISYQIRHGLYDLRKELLLLIMIPVGMGAGEVLNLIIDRLLLLRAL